MSIAAAAFRVVPAGRGAHWISEGFEAFKKAPGTWIGIVVLWFVAVALVSQLPFLGALAVNLTLPMVVGGLLLGTRAQNEGQPLQLEALWAGFRPPHQQPLLLLGVAYLVIGIVTGVIFAGLVFALLGSTLTMASEGPWEVGAGAALAMLVVLLLVMLFSLATWFAPALVVFRGLAPFEALKLSLSAALANIWPLSVYGLLVILIMLAIAATFGLGLLVAVPVLMASLYISYVDIFGEEAPLGLP